MLNRYAWTLLLLPFAVGCSEDSFLRRVTNAATGRTPIAAAVQLENQQSPDQRRMGLTRLSNDSAGRRAPYTTRYQQIAQSDSDWLVRATAIRALNRSRDASATPIFIRGLSDENDIVRVESAKALVHLIDTDAVAPLLAKVNDANENRDVRIWSADALRNYRTLEVARTLANQLTSREFGVAWQAHESLMTITGTNLGYDETAWLNYFTGPNKPFG